MPKKTDEFYMKLCLKLAEKGRGKTSPNPMVGAVIVKNGIIIGSGYHKKAGFPHAEVEAINSARINVKGAVLYVNLEPCNHYGKTPPCTEKIINAGIKRVIIAMLDPNPINKGKGIKKLRENNIKVKTGILENDAKELNRAFTKFITKKIPYVTLKLAESIDGKIATRTGDSKWISSFSSRRLVHKMRSLSDAVIVGSNTIRRDNPTLINKLFKNGLTKQPLRVVVGGSEKLSKKLNIFKYTDISKVIIASTNKSNEETALYFAPQQKRVPLKALMKKLAGQGILSVFVEGGSELAASFLEEKLVDKVLFFISPRIIGGNSAISSIGGKGATLVKNSLILRNVSVKKIESDLLVEGDL